MLMLTDWLMRSYQSGRQKPEMPVKVGNDDCVTLGRSTSYIPYVPERQYLMPRALPDWLPAANLADVINDSVDSLNLGVG
jgi:hypothetical protein